MESWNCSSMPEVEDSDLDEETAEHILAQVYFGDEGVEEELLQDQCPAPAENDYPMDFDNNSVSGNDSPVLHRDSCCSDDNDTIPVPDHSSIGDSTDLSDSDISLSGSDEEEEEEEEDDCWAVSEKDSARGISPGGKGRYYNRSSIRCRNCNESGHIARSCPSPKKVRPCYLCGLEGHFAEECPDQLCFRCLRQGHIARACRVRPYDVCSRCFCQGHSASTCTDLWRQYHNTLSDGEKLVQDKKEGVRQFCYNCGRQGHWGHECAKERMSFFAPAMPFVAVYKKGQTYESKKRKHDSHHSDYTPSKRQYSDHTSKRRHSDGSYEHNHTPQNDFWRKSHDKSHKPHHHNHHRHSTAPSFTSERRSWQPSPSHRDNRKVFLGEGKKNKTSPPTKKRKNGDFPSHHKGKHHHDHKTSSPGKARHFNGNGTVTIKQSKSHSSLPRHEQRGFRTSSKAARIRKRYS